MTQHKHSNQPFLVSSQRSLLRRTIECICTFLLWLYGLVVTLFFVSNLLNQHLLSVRLLNSAFKTTTYQINQFLLFALFLFVVVLCLLLLWKFYNSRRFGRLNRRTYPEYTTFEELLELNLVDADTLHLLQSSDIIVFEENPIASAKKAYE